MFEPVESYVGNLIRFGEVNNGVVKYYPVNMDIRKQLLKKERRTNEQKY